MNWQCNGVTYNGSKSGNGDEAILFLHGFTGSHHSWEPFLSNLTPMYKVICIDIIGHGQTDAPLDYHRYDIAHVVEDLLHVLDQLNMEKVHIVGYSMGGRIAITLASLFPNRVASLLLESTTPGLRSKEDRLARRQSDAQLAKKIEKDGLSAFVDYWERLPLFASHLNLEDSIKKALRQERLSHQAIGLANSLRGMGTGSMISRWEYLTQFQFPVHIITGELDQKFIAIAQQMVEMNPLFQHTVVEGAGHCVHLDKPEVFTAILKEFFSN